MERLQAELARILLRLSVWMAKAAQHLWVGFQKLSRTLQKLAARIPLTAFQWIVLGFVVVGLLFTFSTPPFEAGSEIGHFDYVLSLKSGNFPTVGTTAAWQEQAVQPPLYYAAASALTSFLDTSDFRSYLEFNPFARPLDLYGDGNKNLLLPLLQRPNGDTFTAVLLLRVLNLAMGIGTIWLVGQIAVFLNPKRPAITLLAMAITAFNPMFVFVHSSLGNLPLALLLNAGAIWCITRLIQYGIKNRTVAILVVTLVLGVLVHLSVLLTAIIALAVLVYVANRDKSWSQFGIASSALAVTLAIFCGWWFVRNVTFYGDPLAWGVWRVTGSDRIEALSISGLLGEFAYFRQSYWGIFGVGNVRLGDGLYILLDLFTFAASFGVIYMVMQVYAIRDFAHARRELIAAVTLLAIVGIAIVVYFGWVIQSQNVSGTSVFPFMGAISPLLAAGFVEIVWWFLFFITPPDRSYVRAGDAVPNESLYPNSVWSARFLVALALFVPLVTIAPTYAAPQPVSAVPAYARQVYARYGDVELVGYDMLLDRYVPGQEVGVTLYWRVVAPTQQDLTVSLALVPPFAGDLGKLKTYPGWGKLRTSTWQTGATYADTYYIRLDPLVAGNFPLKLHVEWFDEDNAESLVIVDAEGNEISSVLLDAGAMIFNRTVTASLATIQNIEPRKRDFGGLVRLDQFSFDRATYETLLLWEAVQPMDIDYTMFLQILDANNEVVGQLDTQPPLPTSFWRYGDRYFTSHLVVTEGDLPVGAYRVIAGVYDLNTMQRLTVYDNLEDALDATDYVLLFAFTIAEDGSFVSEELDLLQPEVTAEPTPEVAPTGAEATAEATSEG